MFCARVLCFRVRVRVLGIAVYVAPMCCREFLKNKNSTIAILDGILLMFKLVIF